MQGVKGKKLKCTVFVVKYYSSEATNILHYERNFPWSGAETVLVEFYGEIDFRNRLSSSFRRDFRDCHNNPDCFSTKWLNLLRHSRISYMKLKLLKLIM